MKVVMLGKLADLAGWREREIAADTLDHLLRALTADNALLADALAAPGVRIAIDHALTSRPDLTGAREVAFLPVVSGG